MSTWRELHDDFRQRALVYTEKVPLTEPQVMRWLTRGMSDFQRRTKLVDATKTLTLASSYDLGDDVLEIRTVIDSADTELLLVDYKQYKEALERGAYGKYGFHETPQHFSWRRDYSSYGEWGTMARICTVWENKLLRYPEETDTTITIRYIKNLHPLSAASSQWTSWYPLSSAFPTRFAADEPPDQLRQHEDAFVDYALAEYLSSISNQNALYYKERYEKSLVEAVMLKPELLRESVAPYNMSPFSS